MKLSISFGDDIYSLEWSKVLLDFPKIIKYNSKNWGWFMYDKGKTSDIDYVLMFSKIPSYNPAYNVEAPFFSDILYGDIDTKRCECGSEKLHGKNAAHSHWCPKFRSN